MAAGVMALAIATSVTVMQRAFVALDTARNSTIASQVLQSMTEDIRLLSWSGTSNYGVNVTNLTNLTDRPLEDFDIETTNRFQSKSITDYNPTATQMIKRFTFSRALTDVAGRTDMSGVPNMKKIVLTAKWIGVDGRQRSLSMVTYYAKDGLYAYYSS